MNPSTRPAALSVQDKLTCQAAMLPCFCRQLAINPNHDKIDQVHKIVPRAFFSLLTNLETDRCHLQGEFVRRSVTGRDDSNNQFWPIHQAINLADPLASFSVA